MLTFLRLAITVLTVVCVSGCATNPFAKFDSGSVSFSNHSKAEIWVDRILCDGKVFPAPCGFLSSGGAKASVCMFPYPFPQVFTLEYFMGKDKTRRSYDIPAKTALAAISKARPAKEITLHFIYTEQRTFILKIQFDRGGNNLRFDGELWPDDKDTRFVLYKDLIRSAYDGKAQDVKRLLDKGAPFVWENEPISLTPLEWSVRWDHTEAFKQLISVMPADFSVHSYASCIKLAMYNDNAEILTALLANHLAGDIASDNLQEIFYSACSSAKNVSSLQALLKRYNVGVDYKVRDYGHTLLFVAVQSDKPEIAKWLVAQGANKQAKLKNGSLPADYARSPAMKAILAD